MPAMIHFENASTDPTYNLAMEEFLFRRGGDLFLLWRNEPTVVVGRYQNTAEEIETERVDCWGIHVVRRISGGGAVYHDLGNLNYTFLSDDRDVAFDFSRFTEPIIRTLRKLGVSAENGGRNDLLIDGKKVSGSAQYKRQGRVLHHGSILFDSDLERLAGLLKASSKQYARSSVPRNRATPSVRSRVGNITDFLSERIDILDFQALILEEIRRIRPLSIERLSENDRREIERLRDEKYRNHTWNFGAEAPRWNVERSVSFNAGTLGIRLDIQNGTVFACTFYGDFFTSGDPEELAARLVGLSFDPHEFDNRVDETWIKTVFPGLSKRKLLETLFASNTGGD